MPDDPTYGRHSKAKIPDHLAVFNLLQCRGALNIEISTGMKHSRGSILRYVQEAYGIKASNKRAAVVEIEAILKEIYGHDVRAQSESEQHTQPTGTES